MTPREQLERAVVHVTIALGALGMTIGLAFGLRQGRWDIFGNGTLIEALGLAYAFLTRLRRSRK